MTVRIRKSIVLSQLSITPLIDIVFLLLIFFLVASRFTEEDRELDVTLPSASEAQPLVLKSKEIFINIDADGKTYIGRTATDKKGVENALRRAVANNPAHQKVIIRADENCRHKHVVTVMNLCNQAKVVDYVVTTRPTDK